MDHVAAAEFHEQAGILRVCDIVAHWADLLRQVEMLPCKLVVDAGLASLAVEIVLLSTCLAGAALVAMPLVLRCVVVVQ